MKASKYPRLRSLTRKGKGGQVWVYFRYDMRGTGRPDVNLGTDYANALEKWHKLHNHLPMTIGRVQQAIDRWREQCLPQYSNADTRKSYAMQLRRLEAPFGQAGWHEITLPVLREYLDRRSSKTQGNRELAVLSIVWGKAKLWGMTELPWPAVGVQGWKNQENKRQIEVTDDLFNACYARADRLLRDAMDIATSTGMRITDVRTILLPVEGVLKFRARKTDKWAEFDLSQSPVLTALVERRLAMKSHSVMLLASDTGRQVSEAMLLARWHAAKAAAAKDHPKLARALSGLYLRDMRKRAADLAGDVGEASKLLQHSTTKLTADHYFTKPTKLRAVR